ncbi:NAD-P-binding protein [Vararia minispora EC-137]|uniref:NAD-P-binding protein n=1 Tax=Vararia minispora EC-137 TaxID=1314806 RepID=A0ACB8QKD3_9AGAM|nr:NAD-P-binding protein [Vararia minispora EC-137]
MSHNAIRPLTNIGDAPSHNPSLSAPNSAALPYSRPATPGAHDHLRIGWIGVGALGYHMVGNLAKYPPARPPVALPIRIWNRSSERPRKLQQELGNDKIVIAQSIEEVATTCDVIFTSLAADDVVKGIYTKFAEALKAHPPSKNKIFVETSTVYPKISGELDSLISSIPHCHLITSPVFGQPAAAAARQLVAYMAGDYQSKKIVAHLLVPAVARKVSDLGGNLEKAPTFKLIGNAVILSSMEVIAEAYTMAAKSGIDQAVVAEFIKGEYQLFPSPIWLNYSNKMLNNLFDGSSGFAIDGGVKDATHIRHLSTDMNSPMPTVDVAFQHLLSARALHESQKRAGNPEFPVLDWSAMVGGVRLAAGLPALHKDEGSSVEKDD